MAGTTDQSTTWLGRARSVNPHALDALLALVFTSVALWNVTDRVGQNAGFRRDDAFGTMLLLLQTVPIAARSVAPLPALIVSVTAISVHISAGYEGVAAGTFAALVIVYSVASLTDTRQSILAAIITGIGIIVYFATDRGDPTLGQAATTTATYAAGWGLGMFVRSRREYTTVVEERAVLLERERELQAREAVAGERTRIARELHDVVGHALNLIVVQAGGAQRVLDANPRVARDSLASIESTGRQALTDIERTLGMLRDSGAETDVLAPQPGLNDVARLAEQMTQAGLPVEVTVAGTLVPLPPSVDLSAYRIVQEALTNTLKHAAPANPGSVHASVRITYARDCLELYIADDGRAAAGQAGRGQTQRGLIGMRERVAMFGGEFSAAPGADGGFRVHARLPLEAPRQ